MSAQLTDAIRQLNAQPGDAYTVEVDGRRLRVYVEEESDIPDAVDTLDPGSSPDPPGTVYLVVPVTPMEPPEPYKFDEHDLAPGNLGDPDDLPGSAT